MNEADVQVCTLGNWCSNLGMTPQAVLAANPPIYFERNLRNMVAISRANGVEIVFSTWAYIAEAMERDNNVMTRDYYQQGVAEHNGIIRHLGIELDVAVIDLAATMPESRDFWIDTMHMTSVGTREQAAQYAAFLVAQGLLPPR